MTTFWIYSGALISSGWVSGIIFLNLNPGPNSFNEELDFLIKNINIVNKVKIN